jgi:hypothetical protein
VRNPRGTLPFTFEITAPNVDADLVGMSYGDMQWNSDSAEHQ